MYILDLKQYLQTFEIHGFNVTTKQPKALLKCLSQVKKVDVDNSRISNSTLKDLADTFCQSAKNGTFALEELSFSFLIEEKSNRFEGS